MRYSIAVGLGAGLVVMCAGLAGCGESGTAPATRGVSSASGSALWLVADEPEGARPVAAVKADAKEGDEVVVRGVIGGRVTPLSADSPVFIIMDTSVPSCADMEEDHCATPWDYCCETTASITANSATVQLVSADGSQLDTDPTAAGLKPLDEIIVVGTVGPRPSQEILTIRATRVHRVDG